MLRSSEIKPLFVDLSHTVTSRFLFFSIPLLCCSTCALLLPCLLPCLLPLFFSDRWPCLVLLVRFALSLSLSLSSLLYFLVFLFWPFYTGACWSTFALFHSTRLVCVCSFVRSFFLMCQLYYYHHPTTTTINNYNCKRNWSPIPDELPSQSN